MMVFKFIVFFFFISVSSFEIKDDFEVVDQQALWGFLMDSLDFEVVYGLQDESVLNSAGLRRKLLSDSDSDEVLHEDELKEDESLLNSAGLRRKLLSDSDSDEVLHEDELKEDESVLNSAGLRRKLLSDSDSDEVLNEDELKEDEFVLQRTGLRRKLLSDSDSDEVLDEDELKEDETDSDDHHYFWWLFCFFVFIFASKCLWSYIKDINEIQLDTLVVSNSVV